MKTLQDCIWSSFRIKDLFDVYTGANVSKNLLTFGNLPRITATDANNGVDWFTETIHDKGFRIYANRVSISFLGSCFYQPYAASYDMKIHCISIKGREWNTYTALFVANQCKSFCEHINYGNQLSSSDLPKQRLLLPVTDNGTPDWQFMEDYMKQTEQQILKPTLDKLCKRLIINEIMRGGKNLHPNWKEFVLGEEFSIESTSSSIDKIKLQEGKGQFPYITRSDNDNGIDHFVPKQDYSTDEGNVITIGLDTQTVFYQPTTFYTGQNIQVVRHKQLDKYNALFIRTALQRVLSRFSWGGYGATLTRLRKSRIFLPATDDGKPDFAFMSSFMLQVEQDIIQTTLPILQAKLKTSNTATGGVNLIKQNWKEFVISDVLTISSGVRLTAADMQSGNMPFIGASDSNNGITAWVSNINAGLDENVLGVNYNGSVCEAFYHPYQCLFSDDVKRLHCKQPIHKDIAKYIYLFIKQVILQQKTKYAYGYKFNAQRMSRQTILLPASSDGTPDYDFMEDYMRNLESEQLTRYLLSKLTIPNK